jgi:hypothetical protein
MLDNSPERRGDAIEQFWSFHTVNNEGVRARLKELELL